MARRDYVDKCNESYQAALLQLRIQHVQCILSEATRRQAGENWVWKGTKAFIELSLERATGEFISEKEIKAHAGEGLGGPSAGLWPWLSDGADVVEKEEGSRTYRIRLEYFDAMRQLISPHAFKGKRSIMEMQGLGKHIWEGIDAQEYVDRERRSWNG
ncbi:MAG: hypothetical protein BZY81_04635 [SAR202 cluster bacterium Io17-Chloro-G4]|nr:MAG: hypothetical protein BZY81_04635 [SAR202 cluster bacterium Io17-Chloro-G4]